MKISHHWLLPAMLLVAAAARFVAPLLGSDHVPACARTSPRASGAACAIAQQLQIRPAGDDARA